MKLKSKLFYCYIFFLVAYSCFTLLPSPLPATLSQYHVSVLGLRIIDVTLILLLAAIWYAGFYGYAKLYEYAQLIKDNKDGEQVLIISKGVLLLVMWLPISSTISAIFNFVTIKHMGFMPAAKIIENYVGLILPLAGFVYISMGARKLSELVNQRPSYIATNVLALFLTFIGIIYVHLVATTQNRNLIYHMPLWLIQITIVAPYIYMWFMGLLAVYEIYQYRQKVKGILYKRSWGLMSLGLGSLIVVTIGLQYLTTLSSHLIKLSIYGILAIIYALLVMIAVGFVLIAGGTRKLQRIEEV